MAESTSGGASDTPRSSASEFQLAYVTDVEGNLAYFERWVALNSALIFYDESNALELRTPNTHFVYGGDVQDLGAGGLRLARQLVALKRRHPTRVHLLAGNRDLNKFRFTAELSDADLRRDAASIPRPHWSAKLPTLSEHLAAVSKPDSRAERLKYILHHTLGCPKTFEHRRTELALLQGGGDISDDAVVASFRDEVAAGKDGALRSYLEVAELAAIVGNTLFVHGAVDRRTMRAVPRVPGVRFEVCSPDLEFDFYDSVAEWAAALNAALRRGLADHAARPEWDAERTTRGGEALAAFQNRCAVAGRSVVSNAYSSGGAWPSAAVQAESNAKAARAEKDPLQWEGVLSDPRDMSVAEWLRASGIRRVCVGHKPSGDSPAVLSSDYTGVEIISADTSYSDPAAGPTADGDAPRGCAVACVTLRGASAEVNHAEISGVLKDGRRHEVALRTLKQGTVEIGNRHLLSGPNHDGDPHAGLELDDEWWVKARIVDAAAPTYLCCRGKGRVVEYRDQTF